MAGAYNPFMRGPDIGGWLNDIGSQIMQILMLKKYLGSMGGMGGGGISGDYPQSLPGMPTSGVAPLSMGGQTNPNMAGIIEALLRKYTSGPY